MKLLSFLKKLVAAIVAALSTSKQKDDGPGGGTHPPSGPGGKG